MLLARTRVFLPFFSVAALTAGVLLFLSDNSRTNFVTLFVTLLLWFLGCAMLIVWSAGLTFRENDRSGSVGRNGEHSNSAMKRAG